MGTICLILFQLEGYIYIYTLIYIIYMKNLFVYNGLWKRGVL